MITAAASSFFITKTRTLALECFCAFLGACFIGILAQVKLPLYPVPMTLQTFAVGLLIAKNPSRAFFSTLFYLGMISLGLPVLAGGAVQTFWLSRPTMGYLIAMPLGALLSGRYLHKQSSWLRYLSVLGSYYLFTLTLGTVVLSVLLSISLKAAFLVGFLPFLLPESVKLVTVVNLARLWKKS